MRNRILTIVNILLLCVCGWCIFFLSTETYIRPLEISKAEELLAQSNALAGATGSESGQNARPSAVDSNSTQTQGDTAAETSSTLIGKRMFVEIWTPTPTPTPSPSPTPAPPDLRTASDNWEITSIDGDKVEFVDRRSPGASESFTLTVGGPGRETVDAQNRPITISVIAVDNVNNKITLGFEGQTHEKSMF